MALKIALFAALCVAQAFAFQPSFLALGKNINDVSEDIRDKNLDVFAECFGEEKEKFAEIGDRLPVVRGLVLDSLSQEQKEMAEKYFKALDEPLANFAAVMKELHENFYNLLKEYKIAEAIDALLTGVQKAEEIFGVMGQEMQKGTEEFPDLENASDWVLRWMRYDFDLAKSALRESFGKCLQK